MPLFAFSNPGMMLFCQRFCTFTSPLAYTTIVVPAFVFLACPPAYVAENAAGTMTSAATVIASSLAFTEHLPFRIRPSGCCQKSRAASRGLAAHDDPFSRGEQGRRGLAGDDVGPALGNSGAWRGAAARELGEREPL